MIVAEVEAYFSRPIAPTRRVALGELRLPDTGADGASAMLLGGLMARYSGRLDGDDLREVHRLLGDVERGRRIPQPRLRHRFQYDNVGLQRCTHRLVADLDGRFSLRLDDAAGSAEQQVLAAVYAVRLVPTEHRDAAVVALRRGLAWTGPEGPELLGFLRMGSRGAAFGNGAVAADPVAWAVGVLGIDLSDGAPPDRDRVVRAFRVALREAHPDLGAEDADAARRIAELDAARRILLG